MPAPPLLPDGAESSSSGEPRTVFEVCMRPFGMPGDVVDMLGPRPLRRVVITFALSSRAQEHLSELLGDRVELVDVRAADGQEDAVLVPSTSRQLVSKIDSAFPRAVVLVVEIEDPDYGLGLGGQVMASLDAGADRYYVARSLHQLADVVEHALERPHSSAQQPSELTPPHEDELSSILDRLIRPEAAAEQVERNDEKRRI